MERQRCYNEEMFEPSQWTTFANLVLQHRNPRAEAIFVHAWGDLHDELITLTGKCYHSSRQRMLILNAHEHYEIGGLGIGYWRSALMERSGIPAGAIRTIPPADHTGAEAEALMEYAKQGKLASIIVISHPVHLVRAMLTQIGAMHKHGLDLTLYPQTLSLVAWDEVVEIRSLASEGTETTRRIARVYGECARIMQYNQKRGSGDESFPIASISEGIEYFKSKGI